MDASAPAPVDPVTCTIIQNALQATCDEMFAAMRKTAMSAIIYEVLDMATGITDAQGNLASSGQGIPPFVGVVDTAVRFVLRKFAGSTIAPGDIFITNDPYHGGVTHLNDVAVVMPVFAQEQLVAWTGCIAHWNDVGGMQAGSLSNAACEIFQEGLRLPAVKLIDKGEPVAALLDIIISNSRLPEYVQGDLWAEIAAVRLGERRIRGLVEKYGEAAYAEALRRSFDDAEASTRRALAILPAGQFQFAEEQDDGRVYKVTVEIGRDAAGGGTLTIDLRDNPDTDSGPYNISADGAQVVAEMILKSLADPSAPSNAGAFRPLTLLTKPNTVFSADAPAALGFYFETQIRLYDLIWRCLAEAMPGRLPAGHFGSICGTLIGGIHPDTGRHFSIVEPELGGWGASATADGINANFSALHGETFNCPAEISEARNGLLVDRMALNAGGGAGTFRGGRGAIIDYRIRSDRNFLTMGYTRSKMPPWGLAGGQAGTGNFVEIRRASGAIERHAVATGLTLNKDDVVRIVTGNGGGFGDPKLRPKDRLRADLRDGYVSAEEVERIYGGL